MSPAERIDVDLYSDTVTRPTADVRRVMCEAGVGEEPKFEDPTVNQLCALRAVTHLDVDAAGIERAPAAAGAVFTGQDR